MYIVLALNEEMLSHEFSISLLCYYVLQYMHTVLLCRFRREDGNVRTAMSSRRGIRMRLKGIMKDALPPALLPQNNNFLHL